MWHRLLDTCVLAAYDSRIGARRVPTLWTRARRPGAEKCRAGRRGRPGRIGHPGADERMDGPRITDPDPTAREEPVSGEPTREARTTSEGGRHDAGRKRQEESVGLGVGRVLRGGRGLADGPASRGGRGRADVSLAEDRHVARAAERRPRGVGTRTRQGGGQAPHAALSRGRDRAHPPLADAEGIQGIRPHLAQGPLVVVEVHQRDQLLGTEPQGHRAREGRRGRQRRPLRAHRGRHPLPSSPGPPRRRRSRSARRTPRDATTSTGPPSSRRPTRT